MAKREHRKWTRLDDEEDALFCRNFEKSALKSPSEYVRQAILYPQIKPPPPPEYFAALHDVCAQGNNINQIAFIANASKSVSPEEVLELQMLHRELIAAVKASR